MEHQSDLFDQNNPPDRVADMESDDAFCATPLAANATNIEQPTTPANATFMQDHTSVQRSPSATISQASALSRALPTKSNGTTSSLEHTTPPPTIAGVLENDERPGRGRVRSTSTSSLVKATDTCTLGKTPSSSSKSIASVKSAKSVHSVMAVGSYPLGSLRVHSPSPTRDIQENRLFLKNGDALVVRDMPVGALFGYDTRGLIISAEHPFEGLRSIPPGAHLFWGGADHQSLRTGFWIMTGKKTTEELGEIHVKRWDKENEVLEEEFSAAVTMFEREGIPEIVHKLHPYSASSVKPPVNVDGSAANIMARDPNVWHQLTSSMKGALLNKITGSNKWNEWRVSSADDYKPSSRDGIMPELPSLEKDRTEVLRFVFPKTNRTFSDISSGRSRTEEATDTSSHVSKIIEEHCTYQDSDEIIGEMQFCYSTGMILGNLACQEHWAHIVKVLFKAYRLAVDLPVFFRKVIDAVHVQFMYDNESKGQKIIDCDVNLEEHLKLIFTTFKSRLNEGLLELGNQITPEQLAVGTAFEALEAWLCKLDWDLRGSYVRVGQMQLDDGELVGEFTNRTMKITTA